MADKTTMNAGTGGDTFQSEDIGAYKIAVSKIYVGAHGVDGGAVTPSNPFPVAVQNFPAFPASQVVTGAVSLSSQPDPSGVTGTISAPDSGTTSATNTLGQTSVTGTPTAGSFVTVPLTGAATGRVMLAGATFNGTVTFERSFDGGTTYFAMSVAAPGVVGMVSSATFTGAASTQAFSFNAAGVTNFRIRCPARTAGTLGVTVQPGYAVVDLAIPGGVQVTPGTTGGLTPYKLISAASTNAAVVKNSAGQLYGWSIANVNAALRYLKIYDKATAPTVGSDTPVITLEIPPSNGGQNIAISPGIQFANGIAIAITTGIADLDTGAVGSGDVLVNLFIK